MKLRFLELYDDFNFKDLTEIEHVYSPDYQSKMVLSLLFRRRVMGHFGFIEPRYYYLIIPVRWIRDWADEFKANITREQVLKSTGCEIAGKTLGGIFGHLSDSKDKKMQSVLVLPSKRETEDSYEFRYANLFELEQYILQYFPIYDREYIKLADGSKVTSRVAGIPQRMCSMRDPFIP